MAPLLDVLAVQSVAFATLSFCTSQDLAVLQLTSQRTKQVIQEQAPRILHALYDIQFPVSTRHATSNGLHLISQCEAASTLYLSLTALGLSSAAEPVSLEGLVMDEDRLAVTDLPGATCFSCLKEPAARFEALPFVNHFVCQEPITFAGGSVDCRLRCYDDFATEVADDLCQTVHLTKVLHCGVVLYVTQLHEWDGAFAVAELGSNAAVATSSSSVADRAKAQGRLFLHQAQRHCYEPQPKPIHLPFTTVRDMHDLGDGGVAIVGDTSTLVLHGRVSSHNAQPGRRRAGKSERQERTPPTWTLDPKCCGLVPYSLADAFWLPNGHLIGLANGEVQEWRVPAVHDGLKAGSSPWGAFQCIQTTPIPFLCPAPPQPGLLLGLGNGLDPPTSPLGTPTASGPTIFPASSLDAHSASSDSSASSLAAATARVSPNGYGEKLTQKGGTESTGSKQAMGSVLDDEATPSTMPVNAHQRPRSTKGRQSKQPPTVAVMTPILLQFVAKDTIVGVAEEPAAERKLMGWKIGWEGTIAIDSHGLEDQYTLLRPPNSIFFAYLLTPAQLSKPSICGIVNIDSLTRIREVHLANSCGPHIFGPNLLCLSQKDQLRLFDGKQEVAIPIPWVDLGKGDTSYVCPLSSNSLLLWGADSQGQNAAHLLLLDPNRAKPRKQLLNQQPSHTPLLRPLTDFYPDSTPVASDPQFPAVDDKQAGASAMQSGVHQVRQRPSADTKGVANSVLSDPAKIMPSSEACIKAAGSKRRRVASADSHQEELIPLQPVPWTTAEDRALRDGVKTLGKGRWIEICNKYSELAQRDSAALKARWMFLHRNREV